MTRHKMIVANSNSLDGVPDKSVQLIVTSPPYPMVEMWDALFIAQNPEIADCLTNGKPLSAFDKMHAILNRTWTECDRVLSDHGFVCVNIGDAVRTVDGSFQLFSNHTQVIHFFVGRGYSILPDILWRKPSNAPNKFMGSGMYPAGAYVTYEHEYILIFRKGGKRIFTGEEKAKRRKSAYFWEERNVWFSDLWEIKGVSQAIRNSKAGRVRNASFPLEIPYRLVNMYSSEGDTALDPFAGFGTTALACAASNRNSVGVEIDSAIVDAAMKRFSADAINRVIDKRMKAHTDFIESLSAEQKEKCYVNTPHGFLVKTKQETSIQIDRVSAVDIDGRVITCQYA